MKRTFRHAAEGRTWWIEARGKEVHVGFASDGAPDPVERVRREPSEAAARAELERMVAEQLADGFVEERANGDEESEAAFFDRCLAAWRSAAPDVPASAWRDTVAALPSSLRARLHTELVQLGPPATWRDATWLRMQAPTQPAPFLLALREPRVGGFALWVLDAFVVPRPLVAARVTSMGALDHAPAERAPHLEMALLSLLEAPTEASERGAVALERFPYAAASLERVRAVSRGPAPRAAGAARVLAGHLASRENRAALADWLERSDVLPSDRVDLKRRLGKGADGRPLTAEVLREG